MCKAYGYEDIGGERTLGFGCVRVRRDSGATSGTRRLIGSRSRMANDDPALWGLRRLSRFEELIHQPS